MRKLSAAAQFARSIDGPPTPWISPSWTEITPDPSNKGEDRIRTISLIFRLWVRRRGHSVHIETRHDSPDCPNQIRRVHMSRQGVYYTLASAKHLLKLAAWDRNQPPTNPRAVWDRTKPGYAEIKEHIETVAKGLMRVLEPRRGRPRGERPEPLTGQVNVRGAYGAARNTRRNEIMRAMNRIDGILAPLLERFTGSRVKMAGFEKDEKDRILQHLHTLQRAALVFHNEIASDLLDYKAQPTPAQPTQSDVHSTATTPQALDLSEFEQLFGHPPPLQ